MGFFSIVFAHALAPIFFTVHLIRRSPIAACIENVSSHHQIESNRFFDCARQFQGLRVAAVWRRRLRGELHLAAECILLASLTTPLIHSTGLLYSCRAKFIACKRSMREQKIQQSACYVFRSSSVFISRSAQHSKHTHIRSFKSTLKLLSPY